MVFWLTTVLIGGLSILLLCGKGSFLIAGYNTSGKEQKSRYDEKKLCRVVGGGLGCIALTLVVCGALGESYVRITAGLLPIVLVLTAAAMLVLSHTICRVKNAPVAEETPEGRRRARKVRIGALVTSGAILVVVCVLFTTGQVTARLDTASLVLEGFCWPDKTIPLADIVSVDYTEDFTVGRRTNGFGSAKLLQGHFRNDQLGDYVLYAYTECRSYILAETQSGMVVLNAATPEETRQLCQALEQRLA